MVPFRARKHGKAIKITFINGNIKCFTPESTDMDDFVNDYLSYFELYYPDQLAAIDLLYKDIYGDKKVNNMKIAMWKYRRRVVYRSIMCSLITDDLQYSCDEKGEWHFTFGLCPLRGECDYNGYDDRLEDKRCVICNPVYKTPLTDSELNVTRSLVDTMYDNSEIAIFFSISEAELENMIQDIFLKIGVKDRFELKFVLNHKRII